MANINRVIITGNLTKDPVLSALPSGTNVCTMRIACNGRRRTNDGWEDAPNFFDVTVWGQQGENCHKYLAKGRAVAIDGRLRWREWTDKDQQKRQSVDIIAETVQFLGGRDDAAGGNGNGDGFSAARLAEAEIPIDTGDFVPSSVGAGAAEDDIPF